MHFARCAAESWWKMIRDCSNCKYWGVDYIFDEETLDKHTVYTCGRGNVMRLDFECKDFEEAKE